MPLSKGARYTPYSLRTGKNQKEIPKKKAFRSYSTTFFVTITLAIVFPLSLLFFSHFLPPLSPSLLSGLMRVCGVFLVFILFSFFAWSVVDGERPKLLSSSVWYSNQTVLNVDFNVAVVRMEFDQALYTNGQTFLCPSVDQSCPPLECTACDWSGQQVIIMFSTYEYNNNMNFESFFFLNFFFSQLGVEIHRVVDQLKMEIWSKLNLGVIPIFLLMKL